MIEEGLIDKAGAGLAMSGIPIAYAVSKFIMGSISDRSDARKFMTVGLILSSLVMILAGILPYPAGVDGNYSITVGWAGLHADVCLHTGSLPTSEVLRCPSGTRLTMSAMVRWVYLSLQELSYLQP